MEYTVVYTRERNRESEVRERDQSASRNAACAPTDDMRVAITLSINRRASAVETVIREAQYGK